MRGRPRVEGRPSTRGGSLGGGLPKSCRPFGAIQTTRGSHVGGRIYRDRVNGTLIWWYGAPDDADIEDPDVWRAANPASWLRDGKELAKEYARLRARGALTEWRTYHLDQFVETLEAWMPPDAWAACSGDPVFEPGIPTYAAVRLAHDHRSAAVAIAQRQGDGVVLRVRSFPDTPLAEGQYVLAEPIEEHIVSLRKRYPASVTAEVRFSPGGKVYKRPKPGPLILRRGALFEPSRQRLEGHKVVTLDVPSSPERMTPAAETLMQLVTSAALVHDGDRELGRQVARVVAKQRPKSWAIESGTGEPIVASQAAMLAVHWAMTSEAPRSHRVQGEAVAAPVAARGPGAWFRDRLCRVARGPARVSVPHPSDRRTGQGGSLARDAWTAP
jgi:hypothetical protein